MKKILSAAKQAKKNRDEKILHLFDTRRDRYEQVTTLYFEIAQKVGCSFPTVTRVLKDNGRIQTANAE